MAQSVEHILGKDEVTGSSPVISSRRKAPKIRLFQAFSGLFVFIFLLNSRTSQNLSKLLIVCPIVCPFF